MPSSRRTVECGCTHQCDHVCIDKCFIAKKISTCSLLALYSAEHPKVPQIHIGQAVRRVLSQVGENVSELARGARAAVCKDPNLVLDYARALHAKLTAEKLYRSAILSGMADAGLLAKLMKLYRKSTLVTTNDGIRDTPLFKSAAADILLRCARGFRQELEDYLRAAVGAGRTREVAPS